MSTININWLVFQSNCSRRLKSVQKIQWYNRIGALNVNHNSINIDCYNCQDRLLWEKWKIMELAMHWALNTWAPTWDIHRQRYAVAWLLLFSYYSYYNGLLNNCCVWIQFIHFSRANIILQQLENDSIFHIKLPSSDSYHHNQIHLISNDNRCVKRYSCKINWWCERFW